MITRFKLYEARYPDIFDGFGDTDDVRKIVKHLEEGGDINCINRYGDSLLHLSIAYNLNHCFKFLIDSGINVDILDNFNESPLIKSTIYYNMDFIKILIESDANWDFKDEDGNTFIDKLAEKELKEIKELYPEKYNEYIIKQKSNEFNL